MNTISAIETRYKGYRFRSRLEARWAMFFDAVGIGWTYEEQPISVAGENYLPDFHLNFGAFTAVHEVKSLHEADRIVPVKAYLAGKMDPAKCWRGIASPLDRSERGADANRFHHAPAEAWKAARRPAFFSDLDFILTGPFPLSCDHGCAHGASVHMTETCSNRGATTGTVVACSSAIADSDVVCAHIDSLDAFGTLIEIGIAHGMRKPLSVTLTKDVVDRCRRPSLHDGPSSPMGMHDLWFADTIASAAAVVEDAAEARAAHNAFIAKVTTREYRLISQIGHQTKAATMTFGDPLDVANHGRAHQWGVSIALTCAHNRAAAEAVRAHRFDGR